MFALRHLSRLIIEPPIKNIKCLKILGVQTSEGISQHKNVGILESYNFDQNVVIFPTIDDNHGKYVKSFSVAAVGLVALSGVEDDDPDEEANSVNDDQDVIEGMASNDEERSEYYLEDEEKLEEVKIELVDVIFLCVNSPLFFV